MTTICIIYNIANLQYIRLYSRLATFFLFLHGVASYDADDIQCLTLDL